MENKQEDRRVISITKELRARLKIKACMEGKSMKSIIEELIEGYLNRNGGTNE